MDKAVSRRRAWARFAISAALTSAALAVTLPRAQAAQESPTTVPPSTRPATAIDPKSDSPLFDPDRHMRVADVRPGMKGYGLSVFKGTKIERFDVEVVSVAHNFNPGFDGVLIMCKGQNLEHTNGVQGMSGSPIYLYGPDGKARMLGAFAFGFPLSKDPLIGVQPIEYMLANADPKTPRFGSGLTDAGPQDGTARWSYLSAVPLPGRAAPAAYPFAGRTDGRINPLFARTLPTTSTGMAPHALAVTLSGASGPSLDRLRPLLESYGLSAVAGVAGSLPGEMLDAPATIEPGSSLIVTLMTGDTEISAAGTATEVIGDRVFGFGHPFLGAGGIEMPMGAGYVNTIVASLASSFKIAALTHPMGVLRSDTAVGVGGTFGGSVPMVPITVRITYEDGSIDRVYHYSAVRHERFTPLLTMVALNSSLSAVRELPPEHTLEVHSVIRYAGREPMTADTLLANSSPPELFFTAATPLIAASSNPFGKVFPESVEFAVKVTGKPRVAEILTARALRPRYRAGDTVTVELAVRPYQQKEQTRRVELKLPKRLAPGEHTIKISDAEQFLGDEVTVRPDRFFADDLDGMFAVLREQSKYRSNALYARLVSEPDGLTLGRVALPRLPESRRQTLMGGVKPNVAAIAASVTSITPTEMVISGSAEVTITVEGDTKSDASAGGNGPPPPPNRGPRPFVPRPGGREVME